MNARQLISALVILMYSFCLQAQNETILFGQQKATFGIYQTQYEENLNFVVVSTSFIQK